MKYLLDTNTIIYWWKGNTNIEKRILKVGINNVAVPYIVISELYFGAYNSQRVAENIQKINEFVQAVNIINSNTSMMKTFGAIKSKLRAEGKIIDDADLYIASAAIEYELILVSNNTKHFQNIQELMIDNWV